MSDYMKLVKDNKYSVIFLIYILFLLCIIKVSNAQETITNLNKTKSGVVVLQINADFNKANTLDLSNLNDCVVYYMDIAYASSLNVSKVPTVIIFDGKEKKRYEANIMMKLDATRKDVQNFVDNIILNKFN